MTLLRRLKAGRVRPFGEVRRTIRLSRLVKEFVFLSARLKKGSLLSRGLGI
jgi:hypothetical protein